MEGNINHQDFIIGVKEKRLHLVFNTFSQGIWSAPLPMKYWIIHGLVLSFMFGSLVLFPLVFLVTGYSGSIMILFVVLLGLSYLYGKLLVRYYAKYALINEEFYNYCIKEGVLIIEETKKS